MRITFKTKSCPSIPLPETNDFCNYVKANPMYIKVTLDVIAQVKYQIIDYTVFLKILYNFYNFGETEEKRKELDYEYVNLFHVIYKHEDDELAKIRGDILEVICHDINMCKKCSKSSNYIKTFEALVLDEEVPISPKDIDIVVQHCKIDLLECKCILKNYLRLPISTRLREKLIFLDNARNIINNDNFAIVYFVTADKTDGRCRNLLDNLGYTQFEILTASDILDKLSD